MVRHCKSDHTQVKHYIKAHVLITMKLDIGTKLTLPTLPKDSHTKTSSYTCRETNFSTHGFNLLAHLRFRRSSWSLPQLPLGFVYCPYSTNKSKLNMLCLSRKEIKSAALSTFGEITAEISSRSTQEFIKCSKKIGGQCCKKIKFCFSNIVSLLYLQLNLN